MAKSEITHCLEIIDFFEHPLIFPLKPEEKLIMSYCVKQGAKNNLGIFKEYRGSISMKLGLDHEVVYHFFLNNPKLIGFDPENHLIWIKPFFEFVEFGLGRSMQKQFRNKKTQETEIGLNKKALFVKNAFVDKVNSEFRENHLLQIFLKDWVKYNFMFLSRVNEEVRNIKGNGRSLDGLLQSY